MLYQEPKRPTFGKKPIQTFEENNLCRTQIKVDFIADISEMFTCPNGNHLIIFYGSHKDELLKILGK